MIVTLPCPKAPEDLKEFWPMFHPDIQKLLRSCWWRSHGCDPSARQEDGIGCRQCGTDFSNGDFAELAARVDQLRFHREEYGSQEEAHLHHRP